jgi:hypothetical protein
MMVNRVKVRGCLILKLGMLNGEIGAPARSFIHISHWKN